MTKRVNILTANTPNSNAMTMLRVIEEDLSGIWNGGGEALKTGFRA